MTIDPHTLINGYLDETLSSEAHGVFQQWLQESPQHQQQFADATGWPRRTSESLGANAQEVQNIVSR